MDEAVSMINILIKLRAYLTSPHFQAHSYLLLRNVCVCPGRRLFFVAAKNHHYFQYPQPTHCETENLLGLPLYRGAGDVLKALPKATYRDCKTR
jgi:hypothetical protein